MSPLRLGTGAVLCMAEVFGTIDNVFYFYGET